MALCGKAEPSRLSSETTLRWGSQYSSKLTNSVEKELKRKRKRVGLSKIEIGNGLGGLREVRGK